MNRHLQRVMRASAVPLARLASRAYVAGPHLPDAIEVCRRFSERNVDSTIGYWNDDDDTPESVAGTYLAAIKAIKSEGLDSYLSIKAPPLGFDRNLLAELVKTGAEAGVGIHFDSLG
ncbi:MAG: hypothetical protein J2P41_05395, partial [Blastocatellia bacterium]|nr:hypothetical protein [Blastocatellia bacterium]